jgi:hypothetical protein
VTKTAAVDDRTYLLGPQEDGSYVLRIPDDYHLMILRKSLEKHDKNATAASGTLSPLFDGADPALEKAQRATEKMLKLVVQARAPENQVADTPVGKAIRGEVSDGEQPPPEPELVDGGNGETWHPDVPQPRPRLDQLVRHPSLATARIIKIHGHKDGDVFSVEIENVGVVPVLAHWDQVAGRIEWWLSSSVEKYSMTRIAPNAEGWGRFLRGEDTAEPTARGKGPGKARKTSAPKPKAKAKAAPKGKPTPRKPSGGGGRSPKKRR